MQTTTPTQPPSTKRPATGQDARFDAMVAQYAPKIYALSLRLCRNANEAEDAVQDAFVQALKSWPRFEGRSSPGTWLYTIAVRACRRRRRTASRRRVPGFASLVPFGDTTVADLRSGVPSPPELAERSEVEEALQNAITRLPEAFRLAIVLKDILELPSPDVAAILGVKTETVKTRVHRARLLLRAALMKQVPQRTAPRPSYEKQVCLDLLRAKLEAMDHGRGLPLAPEIICDRCRSVFAELDLTQNACASLAANSVTPALRRRLDKLVAGADGR